MKIALLVIDMQETFFNETPEMTRSLKNAVEYINAAIKLFRGKGLPVFVVEDVDEEDGRTPSSPGFETSSKIDLLPDDPRIRKTYGNAFNKTDLKKQLQNLEIDTLLLTGFAATQCVLSTYRGSLDLDYDPLILRGSIADSDPDKVRFVEDIHELISYGALIKLLELI